MTAGARTHDVVIAGVGRRLPVVPVNSELDIAFLKLYGDTELVEAASVELCSMLAPSVEVIVGPEAGGILLAHQLSRLSGLPYVIARKKVRPNMVNPLSQALTSIGTVGEQVLVLGDDDVATMSGRRVALVDEVVSTGATQAALRKLVERAGATVTQSLAVATEGAERKDVEALCHLPVFRVKAVTQEHTRNP